jgi:NAD(P)-dependent dehydrogenase (short-subunit alcohol dehydrogenase family)
LKHKHWRPEQKEWQMNDNPNGVVVVTGGGDGIGRALCLAYASRGAPVAVVDIRKEAAEDVAREIAVAGGQAEPFACDISLEAECVRMAEDVATRLGATTHLWAHAGVGIGGGYIASKLGNIDWMLSVNVWGTLYTVRAFASQMIAAATPSRIIVTASSISLAHPDEGTAAYGGSKHMSMGIAEGLRAELTGTNVGVSVLCPGLVNTGIWNGGRARPERFGGARNLPEETGEPWKAGLDPADVASQAIAGVDEGRFFLIAPYEGTRARFDERTAEMASAFPTER